MDRAHNRAGIFDPQIDRYSEDATDPDGFFDQVKQFVVQRYCINCDDLSRQVDEYLTSPQVRILGEPAYETTSDKSNFWYSGIASTL